MEIEIDSDEDDEKYKYILGTGFLCNFKFNNIKVLITYNNIIDEDFIDNQEKLIFFIGDEKKEINLEIQRKVVYFNDMILIEIIDEDNIKNNNFIEIDDYVRSKNDNGEDIIYIIFNKNNKHSYQGDKIINKNNYYILKEILKLSEGIILLKSNLKIIGIVDNKINFLKNIIKELFILVENTKNRMSPRDKDKNSDKGSDENIDNIIKDRY